MNHVILSAMMSHIIPLLEEELANHEPEIQAKLIYEAKQLSFRIDEWAKAKLQAKA